MQLDRNDQPYWSVPLPDLLASLQVGTQGLSQEQAAERLRRHGPNSLAAPSRSGAPELLLRQFSSPIILILAAAALLSFLLDSPLYGLIILVIVLVSGLLGFIQEHGAEGEVRELLRTVELRTSVCRDGEEQIIPSTAVVPGDIVLLSAGASIPVDARLIEECDLSVDEAALAGESFPVNKQLGDYAAATPLSGRLNLLHLGTHVVSGTGRAVVVQTGRGTAFGAIAAGMRLRRSEKEFELGVRRFGYLLLEVTLFLVVAIFAFNVYLQRPVIDSFLFSLALGVGLTPQLLPAVISVNLASGSRRMARRQVIVKRLASIENFGSMDVLCSDKTGTLTEGVARVQFAHGVEGEVSERTLLLDYANAMFQSGYVKPIDTAIKERGPLDLEGWSKLDEVPFDFLRKRQSVLLSHRGQSLLVTKGALGRLLEVCNSAEGSDGRPVPIEAVREGLLEQYHQLSAQGYRLLGVAVRDDLTGTVATRESERGMRFVGLVGQSDPLKPAIAATVAELRGLGVRLKLITGDNALIAARIGREAGLLEPEVITGSQLQSISDEALPLRARACDIFAEVEPNQKERLIAALRRAGHVVGYMGDGINDAPALLAADVGLSLQGAVDVAKEAADIVLLERDLALLADGIREGSPTFANTLKHVFMATSANFGNMFSMAGHSLLLPFLPLLPKQILLTNLLTDLPEMTIATDRVDRDWIERPRRWNIPFIKRFMLTFGLVSSVFDYLTFAVLLRVLRGDAAQFRTGWFVESVISAASIVLVLLLTLLLPYSPLAVIFGFVPLPVRFLALLALILLAYVLAAEAAKGWFYRQTVNT